MKISKEEFIRILSELKDISDTEDKIADVIHSSKNSFIRDFGNFEGLVGAGDGLVVGLLDKMFDTEMISYWVWDLDFGRKYINGIVTDAKGNPINLSTAEELYDLIEEN